MKTLIVAMAMVAVVACAAEARQRTVVSSGDGLINEQQKKGPNARVQGPDSGGRYLVKRTHRTRR